MKPKTVFKGQFKRLLESRRRLPIPPEFTEVLDEKYRDALVLTYIGSCLWAFPLNYWMEIE